MMLDPLSRYQRPPPPRWDTIVAYAIGILVAIAFGFIVGAGFVDAAADYPQRCYTCWR